MLRNIIPGSGLSTSPNFQSDTQSARRYDEFVRLSPLYQNLVQELIARVKITKGAKVLCLASGTGLDARAALEAGAESVVGLDRSLSMIAAAREASSPDTHLRFIQSDAAVIPFPNEHFDIILINAAGNYLLDNIYPLFVEIQRVLKPHGTFAFNCQLDEIETTHPEDPQRQLRRFVYLLGQMKGYPVKLSTKPSIEFISQVAQETGLTTLESAPVRITTTVEDMLHQLQLSQFYSPFMGSVPEDKRAELWRDTANTLKWKQVTADNYRYWQFFVFKKQAGSYAPAAEITTKRPQAALQ
jgi:ubiquinone/menaquinone biosynthesis C-methylase UbiE